MQERRMFEVKMTHLQLRKKIIGFVHGQDSHGDYLVPYQHDNCCPWCNRLTDFIERILQEAQLGEFGISCMDSPKLEEAQKKLSRCIDNEINLTLKVMGAHPKYPEGETKLKEKSDLCLCEACLDCTAPRDFSP